MNYEIKKEGKFEYIEIGSGHPLVLLHGLFGALSNWEFVISHFSANYKVIIPLLPIFDLPLKETNVDGLAKFVHEFIEYKSLENVTFLGNSLGGHVGLVYTIEHPEKVHSLVLTGSSGLYEESFGGTMPRREDYNYIKERIEYTFYSPSTATKELVDEVFQIVNDRNKVLAVIATARSAIKHNLSDELTTFKMPVLLIWGRNDNITPPHVGEEFHKLMPNSELHFIDRCGHAPMMERPLEFNTILDRFLEKVLPNK